MNALMWALLAISSQKSQSTHCGRFPRHPILAPPTALGPQLLPRRDVGVHDLPLNFCFLRGQSSGVVATSGAQALCSHGHGHLVILVPTFLLIKAWLGIVSVQLEGGVGRREGEWPRGQRSPTPAPRGTSGVRKVPGFL